MSEAAEDETILLRIQNIVCSVNLDCELDLQKVATTLRGAEYNPRRFQAVVLRIRNPRTTALIFKTGKMIVVGAKDIEDAHIAALKYKEILEKINIPVKFLDYKICNMTASLDVGFPIRLENFFYGTNSLNVTYEPELFPGLIYRMTDPKVVLIIFVNGKVTITGAKTAEAFEEAMSFIYPYLLEYRKKQIVVHSRESNQQIQN